MSAEQLVTLAASVAFLGLAGLAAVRGAKNPLAFPLALLCVDLFAYNGLELLGSLDSSRAWKWLECIAASLAAPLLVHFTLVFLGARRDRRVFLAGVYACFGALSASCLAPFFAPALASYPGGSLWAALMLAGLIPTFGWVAVLTVRHYRESGSSEEKARTQIFIGALVLGVGGPLTDLSLIAGAPAIPRLAPVGLFVSALLLTALALRSRLLHGAIAPLIVNGGAIALGGALAHLVVYRWLGRDTAALTIGTVAVTLVLLGAARALWSAFTTYRERSAHLATLGRLSAQMAHDIRNPLSAIRGAAQYLDVERERGGTLEAHRELLELILEQTERLENVVRDYQRLGRAEPVRRLVDVEKLVRAAVGGAAVSEKSGNVDVRAALDGELQTCSLDGDLVAAALENLVRNALEAMEGRSGRVEVRTTRRNAHGRDAVVIEVEDEGPGMDAQTREQAGEAFFTTKARGTGLGLAFARRVAEAHGGELRIASALGRGTTVTLTLPCETG